AINLLLSLNIQISLFAYLCIYFVSVKTSETDELQVQTVKCGENVTIKCHPDFIKGKEHVLAWYKQSSGKLPELIVRTSDNNANVRVADTFKQRFRLTAGEEKFELSIIKTVEEDAGTYLCVKTKQSVIEGFLQNMGKV
uniref:Ig-like domain-containing protein n=1 Tax=Pygocentrus nattereri TaxID=42514 RepID=A0A3B4CRM3_PYGNA